APSGQRDDLAVLDDGHGQGGNARACVQFAGQAFQFGQVPGQPRRRLGRFGGGGGKREQAGQQDRDQAERAAPGPGGIVFLARHGRGSLGDRRILARALRGGLNRRGGFRR